LEAFRAAGLAVAASQIGETGPMDGRRWLAFLAFIAFALIVAALALQHSLGRP
jgi:hypothetical protein